MSRFFKSAAFPILIVVVLAFFAQRLISPGEEQPVTTYSQFLAQVETDKIKKVTLATESNEIEVEPRGEAPTYETAYPDNTEQNLVNLLRTENVAVDVEGKGGGGWTTALIYILPFVIFLLFWLFIINQMQ
ncbi:MAG: ATP-dependent metallopeptidase FtsH/Yme1/Tma family protein, partial [Thermoleophilaceae bacterium]